MNTPAQGPTLITYIVNSNSRRIHQSVGGRVDDGCGTTIHMPHVPYHKALQLWKEEGYHLCRRPNCFPSNKLDTAP